MIAYLKSNSLPRGSFHLLQVASTTDNTHYLLRNILTLILASHMRSPPVLRRPISWEVEYSQLNYWLEYPPHTCGNGLTGSLNDYSANPGSIFKLKLVRFSAKLRMQDEAECGKRCVQIFILSWGYCTWIFFRCSYYDGDTGHKNLLRCSTKGGDHTHKNVLRCSK